MSFRLERTLGGNAGEDKGGLPQAAKAEKVLENKEKVWGEWYVRKQTVIAVVASS